MPKKKMMKTKNAAARAMSKMDNTLDSTLDKIESKADDKSAVDPVKQTARDMNVPRWTVATHSKIGSIGSTLLFYVLMVVVWTVLFVFGSLALMYVSIFFVGTLPSIVPEFLGVSPAALLSTPDQFLFSWIMPVACMTIVVAGLMVKLFSRIASWLYQWSKSVRYGLYAGHTKKN